MACLPVNSGRFDALDIEAGILFSGGGRVRAGGRAALAFDQPALEQRWRGEASFPDIKQRRPLIPINHSVERWSADANQDANLTNGKVRFELIHSMELGRGSWRPPTYDRDMGLAAVTCRGTEGARSGP